MRRARQRKAAMVTSQKAGLRSQRGLEVFGWVGEEVMRWAVSGAGLGDGASGFRGG
jgi:hypothetical protein